MQGPVAKKDVALYLLETSLVQFHLDPRKSGVALPDYLRKQPQVALDIGLNTPVPIPDLDVGEHGIRCTLSFNRTPFSCVLPWTAIFAMVTRDGKAAVWPEDVPPESPLAKELTSEQKRPKLSAVPPPPPEPPTSLDEKRAKKGGKRAGASEGAAAEEATVASATDRTRDDKKKAEVAIGRAAKSATSKAVKSPKKGASKESPSVLTRPAIVPIGRPQAAPEPARADLPIEPSAAPAGANSDHSKHGNEKPAPKAAKKKKELPPYLRVVK